MSRSNVKKNHPHFKAFQRIGSTGILRGKGINVGWSNQSWFYPENDVDLELFLNDLLPYIDLSAYPLNGLTLKDLKTWIESIINKKIDFKSDYLSLNLTDFNFDRKANRGELAVIIDFYLNPFIQSINFLGEIE